MCYDGDPADADLASDWRKARKEHRCFACKEAIRPGDRYHVVVQIWEGDLSTIKHCARCWAMADAILGAGSEGVQWDLHCGEIWEENFGPVPDEVAALAFLTPDEAQEKCAPNAVLRLADRAGRVGR